MIQIQADLSGQDQRRLQFVDSLGVMALDPRAGS